MTTAEENIKVKLGKRRMDLLVPQYIESLADIITFGAVKYAPNMWKTLEKDKHQFLAAMLRHIFAYMDGEKYDKESGLPHLSHANCNLMFLYYFDEVDHVK